MKKIFKQSIAILLTVTVVFSSIPVKAKGLKKTCNEALITTAAVIEGYEASVISRMAGRAGASTVKGAHGVVFEIIYQDLENVKNCLYILKPATRIKMSESSIDPFADLILTNGAGENVAFIQCKDCTSMPGIRKIINNIGKYDGAKLVGTKECAKLFNDAAKAQGIAAEMIDSGISHETTTAIAEKSLGISVKSFAKKIRFSASVGGLIEGGISAYESFKNGDSDGMIFAEGATGFFNGAASMSVATGAGELVTYGLALVGGGDVICAVAVVAIVIIAGTAIMVGLEKIEEKLEIKEMIADNIDAKLSEISDFAAKQESKIKEIDFDDIYNKGANVCTNAKDSVTGCFNKLVYMISN